MDWLVDGWQQRTQQKLAFAGFMAAVLSLRSDPLRTTSRLRDFTQKLVGYGGAAVMFSGIQETCRAMRGRHDFLNSALSGAVTGALVVGHYQGPQYRLLGVVTWGSLGAVLHVANSVLQPRHLLEDYLIREGLLSPEATRYRMAQAQGTPSSEVGLLFPEYEHRDILLAAKDIKERELRQIKDRAAAVAGAGAAGRGGGADIDLDIADDDPRYQAWLRTSGYEADALLQSPQQTLQQQQPQQPQQLQRPELPNQQLQAMGAATSGAEGESGEMMAGEGAGRRRHVGPGDGAAAALAVPAVKARSWSAWLTPWKWHLGTRSKDGASDSEEQRRRD